MQSLFPTQPFEIIYAKTSLYVTPIDMPGRYAFQVKFSSARKPLFIVRATDASSNKFWTSVPEGRQNEAEGVGKLIEEYIKEHPTE